MVNKPSVAKINLYFNRFKLTLFQTNKFNICLIAQTSLKLTSRKFSKTRQIVFRLKNIFLLKFESSYVKHKKITHLITQFPSRFTINTNKNSVESVQRIF